MVSYQIIYADPPWDYGKLQHGHGKKTTQGASTHYDVMSSDDLGELNVQALADPTGTLLFMWTTGPMLVRATTLMEKWGFQYATMAFVWEKQRPNPGYYTMSQTEFCLVGKMGKIPQPRGARNVRQFLSQKRGPHSAKPDEVRCRIEQMFPTQRKIELFARTMVPGWDAWGIDVGDTEPW